MTSIFAPEFPPYTNNLLELPAKLVVVPILTSPSTPLSNDIALKELLES